MDPVSITALASGIAELTVSCLKTCKKSLGPSQENDRELRELNSNLYSFNAAVKNLQTHLNVFEEDQARLQELSYNEEPLKRSQESLEHIEARLKNPTLVGKYLRGVGIDKKWTECLSSSNAAKILFDDLSTFREVELLIVKRLC